MSLVNHLVFGSPGAMSTQPAIAVDDSGAVAHTIGGQISGIIIQNVGDSECWFGDDNVNPSTSRGTILLPRMMIVFEKVRTSFKVYFKCGTGLTTNIGIVEILP